MRPLSQSVISRYPAVNTGGLSSVDGGAGREDIGFLKSSSVSIAPNFGPFDHSQAVTSAAESRDIMNLWSLLEACLHSGYLDRAFSILQSLYAVKSHRASFIDDYNKFLMKYAETLTDIKDLDKKLFYDLQNSFSACEYNDKTLAILIHYALKLSQSNDACLEHCRTYLKMAINGYKGVLSNVEVLTIQNYKSLVHELGLVDLQDLPQTLRPLMETKTVDSESSAAALLTTDNVTEAPLTKEGSGIALDQDVRPLEKDAKELLAVDTIGMKVVRHTLLGLSLTEEQKKQISSFNFDTSSNLLNFDEGKENIDFFEMHRHLMSDDERKAFEKALDEFNQDRQHQLENRATDAAKERWRHDFEEAKSRGDLSIQKKLNVKLALGMV